MNGTRALALAASLLFLIAASCGCHLSDSISKAAPSVAVDSRVDAAPPTRDTNLIHIPFFITNFQGGVPTADTTLLFEKRTGAPIIAPSGQQVTLSQFNAPLGSAAVKCVARGTHVVVRLSGLIPNGRYTFRILTFQSPGFDGTFINLIGLGDLPNPSGTGTLSLRASPDGRGSFSTILPGGTLSEFGSVASCALSGEFEFHIVGLFHMDNTISGPVGSFVEQLGFIFKP